MLHTLLKTETIVKDRLRRYPSRRNGIAPCVFLFSACSTVACKKSLLRTGDLSNGKKRFLTWVDLGRISSVIIFHACYSSMGIDKERISVLEEVAPSRLNCPIRVAHGLYCTLGFCASS